MNVRMSAGHCGLLGQPYGVLLTRCGSDSPDLMEQAGVLVSGVAAGAAQLTSSLAEGTVFFAHIQTVDIPISSPDLLFPLFFLPIATLCRAHLFVFLDYRIQLVSFVLHQSHGMCKKPIHIWPWPVL